MAHATVVKAPNRLPVLGNALALAKGRLNYLETLAPLGDIVEIGVGGQPYYLINNPDLLHQVLTADSDKFDKGRFFEHVKLFLGNGLMTCAKAEHRRQRRMIQPAFSQAALRQYAAIVAEGAEQQVGRYAEGQVLELYPELQRLTMVLMSKTIFSGDDFDEVSVSLADLLPEFLKGILRQTLMPADFLNKLPLPANIRFQRARTTIRGAVGAAVTRHLDTGQNSTDLMSQLIAARDEHGAGLSHELLVDQVVTFLMAGSETSASTMSWFLYAMINAPELEQEIAEELAEVLQGRPPTVADLPRLGKLNRALMETLRLYCPVWFQTRRTITPVTLGGVEFPVGRNFLYSFAAMHRDPAAFPDPLEFRPDRWLRPTHPRNVFIPFGSGARKCIGDNFSMLSNALVLASFLQRWTFSREGGQEVKAFAGAVLHPQGLRLRLSSRQAAYAVAGQPRRPGPVR
ncbi:cytochrome P450 [Crossiella cryophila]|uniref:Pentalenene oxygenase n=1 Tax=Crossiella cryophila TaxID=43355 RepID=A0A7W7CC33_9PSEU|nr:cytochrome P450 [Crossiella cryophila]MBB4678388.1 pentalenene oxygenase [Crossiella cryophila]